LTNDGPGTLSLLCASLLLRSAATKDKPPFCRAPKTESSKKARLAAAHPTGNSILFRGSVEHYTPHHTTHQTTPTTQLTRNVPPTKSRLFGSLSHSIPYTVPTHYIPSDGDSEFRTPGGRPWIPPIRPWRTTSAAHSADITAQKEKTAAPRPPNRLNSWEGQKERRSCFLPLRQVSTAMSRPLPSDRFPHC
jgi:hypothetical protein